MSDPQEVRDYFAAQVLNALIVERAGGVCNPNDLVDSAYHFADLMMAHRGKNWRGVVPAIRGE